MGTKNKKPIFHVDYIEFNDKNDPLFFFDFLLYPSSCSKIASGVLGMPTESISGKYDKMQLFRGNEEVEISISS